MSEDERKEFSKRLIIEEIKQFCDLYRKNEGIGEGGLDEVADIILNFSKNYISKDKIREKKKKYDEIARQYRDKTNMEARFYLENYYYSRALEELLEEN